MMFYYIYSFINNTAKLLFDFNVYNDVFGKIKVEQKGSKSCALHNGFGC